MKKHPALAFFVGLLSVFALPATVLALDLPAQDPQPERSVAFKTGYLNGHPRLLFGKQDIAKMRTYAKTAEGQRDMARLNAYWQASTSAPSDARYLKDATEAQRQGLWRLPTVALHYVLEGDKRSLDAATAFLKQFASLPHWETGEELDSGMAAANIMVGAALAYDWLYDDLDPAFRETFRQKLWLQARSMYYGGHMMKNPGTHYWQGDPLNNHRWHRDAGLLLSVLAVANGDSSERWLLDKCVKDLEFIASCLPPDGSHHESPSYLAFGASHLVLAMQSADRAFGTRFLEAPFFRNAAAFRMHTLQPGLTDAFSFGDGEGLGGYNSYVYRAIATHRQGASIGPIDAFRSKSPKAFEFAWFDFVFRDPQVKGTGGLETFPKTALFPDIGTLFVRDSWKDDAVAAMFRCGPWGGYTLNKYRNDHGGQYINVAHDDPDANSFVIVKGPLPLAETDRYSKRKRSSNHNTVLVNGIGQETVGRPEGGEWSQPGGDMTKMAVVTAYKTMPGAVIIEGEAAGAYPAKGKARPALERFRRTFVWVEGRYILVLDDLRAPSAVDFEWLMQGRALETVDADKMQYKLVNAGASCPFQIVATEPLSVSLRTSTADHRGQVLGWKQLDAKVHAQSVRIASVYAPWGGQVALAMEKNSPTTATIKVLYNGIPQKWTWTTATGDRVPSTLMLNAKPVLTPRDAAPDPMKSSAPSGGGSQKARGGTLSPPARNPYALPPAKL